MLCEILTGRPPYSKRDSDDVLKQAGRGDVAEALERLRHCGADAALTALCCECLAPQRENRPRDAEAVAQRVAAYQAEVQERLRRAELERAQAEVKVREERKRRRWMLTAVLVLVAGVAAAAWLAVRERKERNEKEQALELAQARLVQVDKGRELLASIFDDLDPHSETNGGPTLRQQLSGRLEQVAVQLDEQAIDDPLTVARLRIALGGPLANLGQARLAVELLSKARITFEDQLGPDDPETLTAMNELAYAYVEAGQIDKGLPIYKEVWEKRQAILEPDHPDTLVSLNNLALTYWDVRQLDEAMPLLEQSLAKRKAKYGPDDSRTITSMNNLAIVYHDVGRLDEAIALYEQALEKSKAVRGENYLGTLCLTDNLAATYRDAGRLDKALPLFEHTLDRMKSTVGSNHPETLKCMGHLALTYHLKGLPDKALPLFEQTLQKMRVEMGPDHPSTLNIMNRLAKIYKEAGQPEKALALLHEGLALFEKKRPNDWRAFQMRSLLGQVLLGQKRYSEAEPFLLQGYEGMKKHQSEIPFAEIARLTEAVEHLTKLYEAVGKKDEAGKWRNVRNKQSRDRQGVAAPTAR